MKIKTANLTSSALDYAVAIAKGMRKEDIKLPWRKDGSLYTNLRDEEGNLNGRYMTGPDLIFSRMWESGGPILTEARISRTIDHSGLWIAYYAEGYGEPEDDRKFMQCDRNELVAGLRCYVAMTLGDEVEIPKELCK